MTRAASVAATLRALRACYGAPAPPVSRDPFQLILWEQVAYLVPDVVRGEAFRLLRTRVGLRPADILAASSATLTAIARKGGTIGAPQRAARMRRSAEMVLDQWAGDLSGALRQPIAQARRALARFPMIGEPGADRILAVAGRARLVPLDSNGLRVLQRLGLSRDHRDYRRAYRAAQEATASAAPRTASARHAAYALLRQHGQVLCRRTAPRCSQCPLRATCPTGRAHRKDG